MKLIYSVREREQTYHFEFQEKNKNNNHAYDSFSKIMKLFHHFNDHSFDKTQL